MKKNKLWTVSLLALSLLYLMGCKKKEEIVVTGEGNTVFTQDFFKGLIKIENVGKQKSIDDIESLQVICQDMSEWELTEVPIKENKNPFKMGHVSYALHYSDGHKIEVITLGKQVKLIDEDGKVVEYEASAEIGLTICDEFNKIK